MFTHPVNPQVLDVAGEGDVASDRCRVVWNTARELRQQQSFRWEKMGEASKTRFALSVSIRVFLLN